MTERPPRKLQTILGRRLFLIAAVVFVANITFVAYYDASDRGALINDVVARQILLLETAASTSDASLPSLLPMLPDHYDLYPDAYGFAVTDRSGAVIEVANPDLFPEGTLGNRSLATDWVNWPSGKNAFPVIASHSVPGDVRGAHVLFAMHADPAGLIRWEVWDEFQGHVLLPLLPTPFFLWRGPGWSPDAP